MVASVEERQLRVYCPTHRINFEVPESGRILCESGGHALALNFPHEEFWEYCCDCQVFWPSEMDKGGKAKEACPVCTRATARRYLCHECKLVSIESDDPARRKSFRITPRGEIDPACPGCRREPQPGLREHVCEDAAATFKTARAKCPFCEETIKKQEAEKPGEKIFCGNCGAQAAPNHSFCKNCGLPVGQNAKQAAATNYAPPGSAPGPSSPYAPPAAPAYVPPGAASAYAPPGTASAYAPTVEFSPDGPPFGTAPLPDNASFAAPHDPAPVQKGGGGAVVAVGVVALVLVLIVVSALVSSSSGSNSSNSSNANYSGGLSFKDKLDRALATNQLFAPSGDCVADLYDAEAARSPGSAALAEAASKIRTRLDPIGDDAIKRYYADSDSTVDWDYVSRVYGLLKKVAPDNQEYAARYAYSLGLVNLKNRSYPTAVSNFQEALRYHANWAMAYNGLGRVYVQDDWNGRDYSKTVEYYGKACDLDTNFTWGCRNLGAYYMKVNDWPDAETYMTKALQRAPGRDTILKTMAKICPKVGKYQDTSTGFCAGGH
jgi:hypothetical protein